MDVDERGEMAHSDFSAGELLSAGDVVIDGGNSRHTDSVARGEKLRGSGIAFLDAPAVVYVVSAAPRTSLEPHVWRYPVLGALPYSPNTAILHTENEAHVTDGLAFNYTLRQPRGIAGLISPWNLPLYLFTWKIAPALAPAGPPPIIAIFMPAHPSAARAHLR